MKEKFKLYGSIFILIIFVPYLLTVLIRGDFLGKQGDPVQEQIEKELPFVVAREISVNSETECLEAQTIIARTNLWKSYIDKRNQNPEAGWSVSDSGLERYTAEELKNIWGTSAYDARMEKFRQAVEETKGEILTCEDQPIQAAYHYAANCKTRNASEVPGQEGYIWLQSVDSEDDMLADGFLTVSYMEKQDFVNALAQIFQEEVLDTDQMPGALELSKRDSAGYVTEVTYGTTVANGEAVRQVLHLNSSCFWFSELDGKIRIVTKGIGHGLGLSQYGANELAKKGKSCREILNYYYTGISIESW